MTISITTEYAVGPPLHGNNMYRPAQALEKHARYKIRKKSSNQRLISGIKTMHAKLVDYIRRRKKKRRARQGVS
jgi:hypothetical protein